MGDPELLPGVTWIWDGGDERPLDAYRLFRRRFDLRAPRGPARLRLAVDGEYRLFVNGAYVGRGPALAGPGRLVVDEHDCAPWLRDGANAIALIVHHLGIPSFETVLGHAALAARLDREGAPPLVSDAAWRWRDAWWIPTGERISPMRGFTEHLDARREPPGWTEPAFDDAAWAAAVPRSPQAQLVARDIPSPAHQPPRAPVAAVAAAACAAACAKTDAAKELAGVPASPPPPGARAALATPAELALDGRGAGVAVLLDLGREVSGFPEIDADCDDDGAVLDLAYAEALDDDGRPTVMRQDNPVSDRIVLRAGRQRLRVFNHRAFRWLVVALRGGRARVRAAVVESGYPAADRGAFACGDATLERCWEVGRLTMRLCMDQGFMDCPQRERGQYIGDALAEAPVALYAFGDTALMRRFLRQAAWCQPEDGLLTPAYPADWTPWHGERGANRIPGFGCLWIVALRDHVRLTGDVALARELAPVIDRLLGWFAGSRGHDGLLAQAREWNFIDWVEMTPEASLASLNLQWLMALRAAADLDRVLGRATPSERDPARAVGAFEAAHWDAGRGLYREAPGRWSVHVNALALAALDLEPERARSIGERLDDPELGEIGSPFFAGFALRGLCRAGAHGRALAWLRAQWGGMIAAGATTFWESFAGQWSRCHAWSSEPTALLSRDILGVSWDGLERRLRVAPAPADLRWASGLAPLPCGDVAVRWRAVDGRVVELHVASPEDVPIDLDVPVAGAATLDGGLVATPDGRYVGRIPGGSHALSSG